MRHGARAQALETMSSDRVTLVTGFPNCAASYLAAHLLEQTRDRVWTVVAPNQLARAEQLRRLWPPALAARFRIFEGDPTAIDMGLSGAEYRELCASVRCIQHLARTIDGEAAGDCDALNVGAMREVLELAGACTGLESLVAHSSLSVSGDRVGHVSEADLEAGQRFSTPASGSLARAELMARRRMQRLPIVVARAGQIVGGESPGVMPALSGIYLLVVLVLFSPQDLSPLLRAFADMPINVVPLDFLARAADMLGRTPAARGHTLHLTDSAPMSVRQVLERCMRLRESLHTSGSAPSPSSKQFRAGALGSGIQAITRRPKAFIEGAFRAVRYRTDVADRILGPAGLCCPALETYLEQVVKQVAHVAASPISAAS